MQRLFPSLILLCLLSTLPLLPGIGRGESGSAKTERVFLHFFYAENCPYCREEKPFLKDLQKEFPRLEIKSYDVWKDQKNLELMAELAKTAGHDMISTPTTVLGEKVWIGFNTEIASAIKAGVRQCLKEPCPENPRYLLDEKKTIKSHSSDTSERRVVPKDASLIRLPLYGRIETSELSLPVLTLVLGLLDSFNPCAFFVLIFLLGLLVHAHSRKTMLLIGGTFVFFSGFIYFLFMAAWLNLFLVAGRMSFITRTAGLVALLMALVNIKDFFFFKKGLSLSISEKSRSRLFKRMRLLRSQTRVPAILLSTIVLALAANSYELLCTAGFPMIFTRLLTLQKLPAWQHYAYLGFYNVVYVVPLLLIVIIFTLTLSSRKMSEWQGRILKLLSGTMMLTLGLILVLAPNLLGNLYFSVGILVLALLLTWLVSAIYNHRRFKPEAAQKMSSSKEKIYRLEKRKMAKKGKSDRES